MYHRIRHLSGVMSTLAAAFLLWGGAGGVSTAGAQPCANADSQAGQASNRALGRSTLCLVNKERHKRGVHRLRYNGRLSRAGRGHALDMVRHSYFAHNSRSGARFTRRIFRTGYIRRGRWGVGENLAWGARRESTPRQIVRAWMESKSHRRNLLDRRFRDLGVGVARGAPVRRRYSNAATYAHEFGRLG
jgi:uncharacterized protein YkwD